MSRSVHDASGVLREVTERVIRDPGNVSRTISETWVRGADNVLRQTWGGAAGGGVSNLAASADPTYVFGARDRGITTVTTNSTTVTVTGGVAPYQYVWSTAAGMAATSPTSPTTAFSGQVISPGETRTADFSCTVTDAAGTSVETNFVTAEVSNYGMENG